MDAVSQGFSPIFFGGAILLFPFIAVLPFATSQVDEIRTGFMFLKAVRTSVFRYSVIKIIAVALSGAAVMCLASLFHSSIWHIVAGPHDPVARPETEVFFSAGTIYDELIKTPYAWRAFLHAALGFAISGAVWSVVGLATAACIPDRLLTVTVSVVLYFFWMYHLPYHLLGVRLPLPSALYNDGYYWHEYFESILTHITIFLIASLVYYTGMKRRLQYA